MGTDLDVVRSSWTLMTWSNFEHAQNKRGEDVMKLECRNEVVSICRT